MMSDREDLDHDAIRRSLERERTELLEMSVASTEDRRPVELDQQSVGRVSRVDAMQAQAMAQDVEARRRARLRRIDAALKRLEKCDYGYCLRCGDEIPCKRLEIDSTATHCVNCAAGRA